MSADMDMKETLTSASAPDVVLEDVGCPMGCQRNDKEVLSGRDRLHDLPGEFAVVRCMGCGLLRTNPRPTPESMGFFYPDDYGPHLGTVFVESRPASALRRTLAPLVRRVFNSKAQVLPDIPPARMLEIGCASGAYMRQMSQRGWQVEGLEFAEKPARTARQLGFKVHQGALETAPPPDEAVDLVVGWMVIEHLHDPIGCCKKLHGWSTDDAWLVFSVPNANSLEFRVFRDDWYALQLPTHLHHFTPRTIAAVLEASGWSLEKIHHQRNSTNLLASLGYVLQGRGWTRLGDWFERTATRGGLWFYMLFPLGYVLGAFGQSGRMTVWARKSGKASSLSGT